MPNNDNSKDEMTLEELRNLVRTDENALISWLYPRVMARVRGSRWRSDYLEDGFNDRKQRFLAGVADAPSVQGFVNFAVLVTTRGAIDLWRKENPQSRKPLSTDEFRIGKATKSPSRASRRPKKRAVRQEIYETKREVILRRLTFTEQQLFELYFGERLKSVEIAAAMDWTLNYCYRACSLLMQKVTQVLRADMEEEDDEQ